MLSLSSEPRHGYSIIKDVEQLSRNSVSLSTGTLYGALKRLLDQGWIERVDDPLPTIQTVCASTTLTGVCPRCGGGACRS
ncbi:MAG: helix-turn-helix transcriptional regulator [Caldilineaceae bacterium]